MRNRPQTTRRGIECVVLLASIALGSACTTLEHASSSGDAAGRTLATNTAEGAERLELERRYDSAVAAQMEEQGKPAYLHVVDRDQVYLFYPDADRVVVITRNGLPPGEILVSHPIPGHFYRLLPRSVSDRLRAARAARGKNRAVARKPRKPAAPAPAALDAGASLAHFDTRKLMERFREPLSAADPGVSGWREVKLADGARAAVARGGAAEYRIRPEHVSASVPIRSQSRDTPAAARMGYSRVNRAVFGTRANAVNQHVAVLVDAVAADPSGRTRRVSRVAGRTVTVVRDTARGALVYGVGAD